MAGKIIRCKMMCADTKKVLGTVWDENGANPKPGELNKASFYPVFDGSAENKKFFASTPAGSLEIQSMRDMNFERGKEYYIDIHEA